MDTFLLVSTVALWGALLFLGFALLGTLRALGVLSWRLAQLEATTPRRVNRDGLRVGTQAPAFTLPSVQGANMALHDYAGRKTLLVFLKAGCGPCRQLVPELNRLQRRNGLAVIAVNNGGLGAAQQWARETGASFPVLAEEGGDISRRYAVFAVPFAFFIDERGVIRGKGHVKTGQDVGYVLDGTRASEAAVPAEAKEAS
jgi:methylamine dehydrogenase accessory protein MauD